VYGSYRIELVEDSVVVERRILGIRTPAGLLIPALNEEADDNANLLNTSSFFIEASENNADDFSDSDLNTLRYSGWWRSLHEVITRITSISDGGGTPGDLDTTHSPVFLCNFNGSAADESGFGNDIVGLSKFTEMMPGYSCAVVDDEFSVASAPELQISGDITIILVANILTTGTSSYFFVRHGGSGELEVNNNLYQFAVSGSNYGSLAWAQESGAGSDASYFGGFMPFYTPVMLSARRASNVVSHFVNGIQAGASSSTLAAPTGGSSGVLVVGTAGVKAMLLGALKIIPSALSDAEILAEYNKVFASAYGTRL
jgi:hypothetical protein